MRLALIAALLVLVTGCRAQVDSHAEDTHADPKTQAGACAILVGQDDLVGRTLKLGHQSASDRDPKVLVHLQDRLFSVVVAHNLVLWEAAGQLVDYLDDPDGYNRGTGTIPKVEAAVVKISTVCGRS